MSVPQKRGFGVFQAELVSPEGWANQRQRIRSQRLMHLFERIIRPPLLC
ncbi:hypothetical protein RBWH47_03548 [Rhodopirellula baltica WH47]|uniref:Uncharacterized protein n=1 Tax=Rhodopirellula baltica WH47 TaxID=991778 RepID=F2AS84_RHOBT|nr:hypothetical protein RBWH47_03548 [Rhodopirellula baltica WH47]